MSLSGGFAARWAPDGKELYYLNLDGRSLMAVPVSTGETLKIGTERKLFDGSFRTSGPGVRPYDVMPDGKRFVDDPPGLSHHRIAQAHRGATLDRRVEAPRASALTLTSGPNGLVVAARWLIASRSSDTNAGERSDVSIA